MEADLHFVIAAIRSCTNLWQLGCCEKLIELFCAKHGSSKYNELIYEMVEKQTTLTII